MSQTVVRQSDTSSVDAASTTTGATDTAATEHVHPLDDPSGLTPLCDEETFAGILEGMVADEAPRVFAIVQEYGERVDGYIAAWGMAFDHRAEVISVQGGLRISTRSAESALRGFDCGNRIRPRVVWVDPNAATPTDDLADDDA